MIQLEGITKVYRTKGGETPALNSINLEIGTGEYVAIVGRSGSGKSTLLNLISGIDHPTEGTIKIEGELISRMNESQLASWRGRNIGIVFQFFQLIPTLTILENLRLAMEFVNVIPKAERKARAMKLLQEVGIESHADKLPATLSGGEQQRAAIARALANNPSIIIADEPTGNLDSKTAGTIKAFLNTLSRQGKTIILVTHDMGATAGTDRVISLMDGEIVAQETPGNQVSNSTSQL